MARSVDQIESRRLRTAGKSITEIARIVSASKGSVSRWCQDIKLTEDQIDELEKKRGAVRYGVIVEIARRKHEKRELEISKLRQRGFDLINEPISNRELLILGSALYWGEGIKRKKTGIINSDPAVLKIFILWLKQVWDIPQERLVLTIRINSSHQDRVQEIEEFWSRELEIPLTQFNRTLFINVEHKKKYEDRSSYHGTVTIYVRNGGDLNNILLGTISGIQAALKI